MNAQDVVNKGVDITNTNVSISLPGNYSNQLDSISKTVSGSIANGDTISLKGDLINNANNGVFVTNAGLLQFNGTSHQSIIGDSLITLNNVWLKKNNGWLKLESDLSVASRFLFDSGTVYLDSSELKLGSTGFLENESNYSFAFSQAGFITANKFVSSPVISDNISGLGLNIGSTTNFSFVDIKRGHDKQIGAGNGSVLKYFELSPTNSGSVDTLLISYFDSDVAGSQNEDQLTFWQTNNSGIVWTNGGGEVDTANNYVSAGSQQMANSIFTLSEGDCDFPPVVNLPDSIIRCQGDTATLNTNISGHFYSWSNNETTQSIIVSDSGKYFVTVTSVNGCVTRDTIEVIHKKIPSASFTATNVCLGLPTVYTNHSTISGSDSMFYSWNFGDTTAQNDTSVLISPNYIHNTPGIQKSWLIAKTIYGCADTTQTNALVYDLPVSNFGVDDACSDSLVEFTDSAVVAGGFNILSRKWFFGDGDSSTAVQPNHTYAGNGTYTVQYSVTTNTGCSDSVSKNVSVYPNPIANFSVTNVCEGIQSIISDSSTVSSGIMNYSWSFGDNTTDTAKIPQKIYAGSGTYQITLIVETGPGCMDSISKSTEVYETPVSNFSVANACADSTVLFSDSSALSSNFNYASKTWYFGDNTSQNVSTPNSVFNVSHVYITDTTYQVLYVVSTTDNCVDSSYESVTIHENPLANFTVSNNCVNQVSQISNNSVSATNYSWNFGDGSLSSATVPQKTYSTASNYTVILNVSTANGCSHDTSAIVTIHPQPLAGFQLSDFCLNDSIQLTNTASITTGSFSNSWFFGDGSQSIVTNPKKGYVTDGAYVIKQVVTSGFGCKDSLNKNVSVFPIPTVQFNASKECEGNSTIFTNTSTVKSGTNFYSWNFGNTATSVFTSPIHKYASWGSYNVKLKTLTNNGCQDSVTHIVQVDSLPSVNLGANVTTCGSQFLLKAGNPGSNYLWSNLTTADSLNVFFNGWYAVTVTSPAGCSASDTVSVTLNSSPSTNLGPDVTNCGAYTVSAFSSGANYLWNTGGINSSETVLTTDTLWVLVTDQNNCQSSDTIIVNIDTIPTVSLGADFVACLGDTNVVGPIAKPGLSYLWSNGAITPLIDITNSGYYRLTVTDVNNCQSSDTIQSTFNQIPSIDLGNDTSACDSFRITAQSSSLNLLWNTTATSPFINVGNTGLYWAQATNGFGCTQTDSIYVVIDTLPTIYVGADFTACAGDTVSAGQYKLGLNYMWNTGSTDSIIDLVSTGTYSVEVEDVNGCKAEDTLSATFNITPTVDLGVDTSICDSVTLYANNLGSSKLWNNTSTDSSLIVTTTGKYWLQVTNIFSCKNSDTVNVEVNSTPVFSLGNDTSFCNGDSIVLSTSLPAKTYQWQDLSSIDTMVVKSSGKYWLFVEDSNSCTVSDTISVLVNSKPQVTLGDDIYLCLNDSALINTNAGNLTHTWYLNDSLLLETGIGIYVSDSGLLIVEVSDSVGCVNTDSLIVNKTSVEIFPRFLAASEIFAGDTVQFVNLSYPSPLQYHWNFGDGSTSVDSFPTNAYYIDTTFTVTLAIENEYCKDSVSKDITVKKKPKAEIITPPASPFVKYSEIIDVTAFPNPTRNQVTLRIEIDHEAPGTIELYNLQGTRIARSKFVGETIEVNHNIQHLKTGVYIYRIGVGTQYKTVKVIKL
ncbi:MAG: PKD domain-containing protein [Salibacteraceae bacterium]